MAHLLLASVFLLVQDARRLFTFFVLNRAAPATDAYEPHFARKWQRFAAIGVKAVLILFIVIMSFKTSYDRYQTRANQAPSFPFKAGVYDVTRYVVNGDTLPLLLTDSLRWRDVVFDNSSAGSVNTADTLFWRRYRRGYFRYKADTATQTVAVWRTSVTFDSTGLFTIRYAMPDTATIQFWTRIRNDSVQIELVRSKRHFQLAERQFHWLSEYNR